MKRLPVNTILILSLFVFGSVLFFEINYKYWYHFMEQYVLFLYTKTHFISLIKQPGGLTEYLTEYITQFFALPLIAPIVITTLLVGVVVLFYQYIKRCGVKVSILIATLPVFLFFIFPLESIAVLISVLIALAFAVAYTLIVNIRLRLSLGFLFITMSYFLAVPANLLVAALVGLHECCVMKNKSSVFQFIGGLVWAFILPLLAMRAFYVIPMREAYISKFLYHPEYPIPYSLWLVLLAFPVVAILTYRFQSWKEPFKQEWINRTFLLMSVLCVFTLLILYKQNPLEQAYRYDYYARNQEWEKIVSHAQKHNVKDKDALIYVNMAHAYVGKFNEGLLAFPQIGEAGFIPHDPKTRLGLIQASEVAWLLNHTNAAQRFAFVGVLSSERCVQPRLMKRLVETYLVNEEYRAAEKYIKILESTHFYSNWAKKQRAFLSDATSVNSPLVVAKRRLNPITDNPFDLTTAFPNALAFLIDDHLENRVALGYGMGYLLLEKDIHTFMTYMERLKQAGLPISKLHQEAICMYYSAVVSDPEAFQSYAIDPSVYNRFVSFSQQYKSLSPAMLANQYGDTYFYYAQFAKTPKQKAQ